MTDVGAGQSFVQDARLICPFPEPADKPMNGMKILYHGPLCSGSTSLQRADSFALLPEVEVNKLNTLEEGRRRNLNLYERVRWRLGIPRDYLDENERLLAAAQQERPNVVLVDNSKVIRITTLRRLTDICNPVLAYYSPDDMIAPRNLKRPLLKSFPHWDIIFTTKGYNVAELRAGGARNPVLIGNAFDPALHRPLSAEDVGSDFERFDLVFIGAFEQDRARSIQALAEAGMTVLVHGSPTGLLSGRWEGAHPNITLRPPVFAEEYVRCLHHGKIALCFLRKANRDCITTRSIEIPAAGRPMLAEKTAEHDAHFVEDEEYRSFVDDEDLVAVARALLVDPEGRRTMGKRGRHRCLSSGYSTIERGREMIAVFVQALGSGKDGISQC